MTAVYDEAYVRQYDQRPHREMSALRWRFIQTWLELPDGAQILDIGYGNGAFLRYAQERGMRGFGLDVHGEDFGIETVGYDTAISFDLICFFDSLEHLPGFGCLFGLRATHVVVSVPRRPDCLLRSPGLWRHYKPGEHLHYFSGDSLDHLMCRWGLPRKIVEGTPEDALRGRSWINSVAHDNIHTAIYARDRRG